MVLFLLLYFALININIQLNDTFPLEHESKYHQKNGYDCGVFVCVCMEEFCKGKYNSLKLNNNWILQQAGLHVVGKCVSEK